MISSKCTQVERERGSKVDLLIYGQDNMEAGKVRWERMKKIMKSSDRIVVFQ